MGKFPFQSILRVLAWSLVIVAMAMVPIWWHLYGPGRRKASLPKAVVPPTTQQTSAGKAEKWSNREYYLEPNQTHLKTLISGDEATPLPKGRAQVKGLKVQTFRVTGEPEMVMETPECIYDQNNKVLNSSGPLKVHAGGGKFFVEGNGFLFRQDESSLVISNQVHSILQTQSGTNGPASPPTEVFSDSARFEMKAGVANRLAIYLGDVRVLYPKMNLTSEILTANLPGAGEVTNRMDHIVAETNVVIDYTDEGGRTTHATGGKAVYDKVTGATNEVLELTENPRLDITNGWMTADLFTMDRAAGRIKGKGNYHYQSKPQAQTGGLSQATVPPTPGTEILADEWDYDTKTRLAVYQHSVRVNDPKLKLVSEHLIASQEGSAKGIPISYALAETNVAIDFFDEKTGKTHATGDKAVYTHKVAAGVTNEVLELTGNPVLESTNGWMMADVVVMDRSKGILRGTGNHHSIIKKQPGEAAAFDTEIFSDAGEFDLNTRLANYGGNVRLYDPGLNLTCKTLNVTLPKSGEKSNQARHLEHVVAEGKVVIDFAGDAFGGTNITGLASFAIKLRQPAAGDGVSQYLAAQLSSATRGLLSHYGGGTNSQLQGALAQDLNRIVQSGSIYDARRFAGVKLSAETSDLLRQKLPGIDVVQLNRMLLLDAYPVNLSRNQKGEKNRATGDKAVYTYHVSGKTTNEVVELTCQAAFLPGDIKDMKLFTTRLKGQPDAVSKFLATRFSATTRQMLSDYPGDGSPAAQLHKALVDELNAIIPGPSIYEKERFTDVPSSEITLNLFGRNPSGEAVARLNRLLLNDAYPLELTRNQPRVERPDGWTTADIIILDRTKGTYQAWGEMESQWKLPAETVVKMNVPAKPKATGKKRAAR